MAADLVNKNSISSQNGNTTGSVVQFLSNTQRTAWVNMASAGSVVLTINAGYDLDNVDFPIDTKTYQSGTAAQSDVYTYNMDFPFMNAVTSLQSGSVTTSVRFTGRGQ